MAVTDARIVRGDGTQAGSRGRERMRFGPFRWDVEFEVAEAVPGRRIVWQAIDGAPFDLAVSLDLAPVTGERTQATYAADIRLHGLWRVLAPMVAIDGKSGPEAQSFDDSRQPVSRIERVAARALDIGATPRFAARMRIGELAREVGVSTDTVRFYERSGWLPRASRRDNAYRDYGDADVEHLRLLIDLRRLDVPLEDAARIAGWCHSGHCADTTDELPRLIAGRRAEIADRIAGLQALDARLMGLQSHLEPPRRLLPVVDGACCDAAGAVTGSAYGGCACCTPEATLGN